MSPGNCENSDCEYVVKYKDNNQNIDFVISTKINNFTNFWFGIGFSYDQMMVNLIMNFHFLKILNI